MAKFKSLKQTRWTRFRAFLRGLLLYNTVYWNRASDGVDRSASRIGRAEREKRRPQMDPELLRPRARPAVELPKRPSGGKEAGLDAGPMPEETPSAPRLAMPATGDEVFGRHLPDAATDAGEREARSHRRRRVVRRRELHDKAVDPSRIHRAKADAKPKRPMPSWLRWLIGWHH